MERTPEEIKELKSQWVGDPCWDIEGTEGFEEHHDELLQYRKEVDAKYEREHDKEIQKKADELQCSVELARYIELLEFKLQRMQRQIDELSA